MCAQGGATVLNKLFSDTLGMAGAAWRIARNARSTVLNRELLGTTLTGAPYPVLHRDGQAYAAATDDHHPSYDAADGIAPPLFAVRVLSGPMSRLLLHPQLGMNFLRMLHGEQSFRFLRPLSYGTTVTPTATLTGFREVSTGIILDIGLEIRGEDGEDLVTGTSSFFLATGGGSGEKKPSPPGATPFPDDAPGRFSRAFETDPGQPSRYASASGDRNPIHTNELVARLAGLPRPIMHGLCMMAMAGREVLASRDAAPSDLQELSLRFARKAFPGARYVIHGADATDGGLDFVVLDSKDRPVLSRGHARLA
jgi:acyl dehydratase